MTTTDPITLAREVIRQQGHLDRDALSRREKERLDLARAVLRTADLADQMDDEAATCALDPDLDDSYEDGARDTAARIRAALNGDQRMIDHDHPAVGVSDDVLWAAMDAYLDSDPADAKVSRERMSAALTAALQLIDADDLRRTEAGKALLADGWTQALDFLWAEACAIDAWEYSDARIANPYREETPNE